MSKKQSNNSNEIVENISKIASDVVMKTGDTINKSKKAIVDTFDDDGNGTLEISDFKNKTMKVVSASTKTVINALDENGNGQIDIEDVITKGLRIPGIGINREQFLRKEFFKYYPEEIINKAVETTPAQAGILKEDIDKISNEVIQFERTCVSGISAALSAPGGFTMIATIPADIVQFYGYMLRAAQKLMYLHGFPDLNVSEKGEKFDSETMNILIVCLGVMYGVSGTNKALIIISKHLGDGVSRKIANAALTKGTIYPIVKEVAKWFNISMTKTVFAGFFKKAIPVVGGAIGGGITYLTFKPCCDKLKKSLENTILSNPNYSESNVDEEVVEIETN